MRKFLLLSVFLALPPWAQSQTKTAPVFENSGTKVSLRPNGVRLDGTSAKPARIRLLPQLDIAALAIAADYVSGTRQFSQFRALGNAGFRVAFKVNFPAKAGNPAVAIDASCLNATLTVATRTLVLKGDLKGFYKIGDGPQNPISGETATFVVDLQNNVSAQLEGGASGVSIAIPASGFGSDSKTGGSILISAKTASVDQKTGEAIFTGNARAKSSGTTQDFEVSAPAFTVSRGVDGALSKLVSSGKTGVKLDLPPDATSANSSFGRPTRVEVTADSARVDFPTATGVFEGNVSGFYRLQPQTGAAQNYRFSGGKAVITFKETLGVDVTGEPVTIEAPGLEF